MTILSNERGNEVGGPVHQGCPLDSIKDPHWSLREKEYASPGKGPKEVLKKGKRRYQKSTEGEF